MSINANTFEAVNGGQISTATFSSGQAGNITLNASDRILITGTDSTYTNRLAQFGEEIVGNQGAASGLFANSAPGSTGNGGNIFLQPRAIALGEQKAKEWESQKIHRDDSVAKGPLTDKRLDARIDAARKVAKQFKCELINEANNQACELQKQKPEDIKIARDIAEQHRQQAQTLQQHTLENLSGVEEQALSQLTEAQVKLTETADQSLQSTLQFLHQQETVQLQVLEGYGQRQILAIERDAQRAIAELQNGVSEIAT
ncbi:hypothetical protein [Scytonema sp. NUACC26]|uniref:hypothetical protein n=1 Tax=Scytonema sp. NUACC26 TaxID=3140176 RepID=UPI0034DC9B43